MAVLDLPPAHIRIRRARPCDALAIVDVEAQADDPDPGFHIMFGGRSATALPSHAVAVQKAMRNDPAVRYYVAVVTLPALDHPTGSGGDDAEGDSPELVVGVSRWHFRTDPTWNDGSREEKDSETNMPEQWPQGANVGACNEFFSWIYSVRKKYMGGKAHARNIRLTLLPTDPIRGETVLSLLATRPDFQRRGIGSELIRYGLNIAEELGLPTWLEASRAGYPVYKKWGFEDLEVRTMDYSPFGKEWTSRHVAMVRGVGGVGGAKDTDGGRSKEKEEDGKSERASGGNVK